MQNMMQLKIKLIQEARIRHDGKIYAVANFKNLLDCFTIQNIGSESYLILWYNTFTSNDNDPKKITTKIVKCKLSTYRPHK